MGKSNKYRPSSRSPERRGDDGRRYEKRYKKRYDDGSGEEYSGDERTSRVKGDEYYREKERRKREKEEKKERKRREKEKEEGGEYGSPGRRHSRERSPQGQSYQPTPPHGQHYSAQTGQGHQAPPHGSGYPATGLEYPDCQPSPCGPGAYSSGGYQPPPPPPPPPAQDHPPTSPGYGGFQGPPSSPNYAAGSFQGYPPAPGPPLPLQQYGGYSGGSASYGYPPPPPPPAPQQEYGGYGQGGHGQLQYPAPPHQPPSHPAVSQGYSAYVSPTPPPKITAGGAAGGQHYKPQHHSAQQQQAYYGHEMGSTGYPTSGSTAVQFENTNPANPHSKPSAGLGGSTVSALETFTGALTSSLHSYARTLFPATSAHKPIAQHGAPAESGVPAQQTENRFDSFAREKTGNGVKWYVDGKDYMYAVSIAIENARQSIWILDWWLSPELYLRRPPKLNEQYRIDVMLKAAAERGVKINVIVYKEVTQALTLSSHHTKTSLEKLHPNITVFRHPDHLPDRPTIQNDIWNKVTTGTYQLGDGLKGLYGMKDGVTMYWAHHEKLCLVDGEIAFMGGLDLCFGRWDLNHHPIADAHPSDLRAIIFPGQDYNNSRFMDFHTVDHWEQNKVKREEHSRMGWSDVALSLIGPSVKDLQRHFIGRWNFIYDRDVYGYDEPRGDYDEERAYSERRQNEVEGVRCQIVRSSSKWSHGLPATEHSIAHAYIEIISAAKHFIYIENQFFITATDDKQSPILNKIGRAIVDRILRADRERRKFKMIIVIPAIPAFAGDLKDDGSLGTRAIMEFQYRSIYNDRGYSIMEQIAKVGVDPKKYIRFYNLRSYDRINAGQLDAFVSEELYVHSKLLIADDRIVICGSANLNDRSQLGEHDSEIAIIIEDPTPLPSLMDNKPYTASHFAATLRRQIFRKHLGLIPAANLTTVDENMHPVPIPNIYDFDSQEDSIVKDPLSETFENFWDYTARTNTVAFERVFHAVPTDKVTNWKDYDEYWGKHFRVPPGENQQPKIKWGHVVRDEFNPDPRIAVGEIKSVLATVRGHLVEMPLGFLREEDIAREGLGLNAITESLYT
ncbi:phospholipase D/nuclease [Tuber magnatum]|uniref:phospholipase D n=1 Tax=Tuber magnatum TaxID=42249 RepID=A0A317SZ15_9PEZI|nr:phospholipase D/nuclease [Tuber magnatum]